MKDEATSTRWADPDDAPEWTEEVFRRGALSKGGHLIRPATGTMTRDFTPEEIEARRVTEEVVLKLDRHIVEFFRREGGKDWSSRINAALQKHIEKAV